MTKNKDLKDQKTNRPITCPLGTTDDTYSNCTTDCAWCNTTADGDLLCINVLIGTLFKNKEPNEN